MTIATGAEFLKRMERLKSDVWMDGARIEHPYTEVEPFRSVLRAKSALYDMVHDERYSTILQAKDKQSNFSFEIPRTKEDLIKRRKATQLWANQTLGVLGRSPDYVNTMITIMAGAKDFFSENDPAFGDHIDRIYRRAKEHDLTFTHTFVNPSISRKPFYPDGEGKEQAIATKIVEETEEGIIIDGARLLATQGGITDELLVVPSAAFIDSDYLFGCTVPSDAKGLTFINRPAYKKESVFDSPLSAQYEEGDAIVVFDHVFIPWERVFLYRDEWLMNELFMKTGVESFLLYQAVNRQVVKTEWVLGIAQALVATFDIERHQHIQGKLSEIIIALEAMMGFVYSSEAQAELNDYGIMVPKLETLKACASYYQSTYPRLIEIIQLLGASHFIAAPSEKDFNSEIAPQLERFVKGEYVSAYDKFQLIQLARDLSITEFGSRQLLYERYFYGDPIRVLSSLNGLYRPKKEALQERVHRFLKREK
ncbi:4-hydroxyphenylacetate 3-monooxygenase [Alkalihalobacillus sp. LMS6]|uniref:4-hydroxyphenylacetate 3-hydroxylase family protein n=1 Tax=Alkalihalobacillus sp. LMS6 TaxID=2924034 RepID=UPI0020D1C566|nr:4-hydroxyphenylacetate 3-hydroxylase N-terminal domain-containing protein [Alkalihalobacillus sp. LMS6]UTR05690.1 4-hydroxyphenylacetate 3-monooxygenase [Alkalihalobacillus sp. LMS6]